MVWGCYQTRSAGRGGYMRPVSLEQEATERSCLASLMRTQLRRIAHSTCLQNPSQFCGTSSECLWMKTRLSLIPPAEVAAPCERLTRLVQHIFSELKSIEISPNGQISYSTHRGE